jgi:hypothetical protein
MRAMNDHGQLTKPDDFLSGRQWLDRRDWTKPIPSGKIQENLRTLWFPSASAFLMNENSEAQFVLSRLVLFHAAT